MEESLAVRTKREGAINKGQQAMKLHYSGLAWHAET
jgi:hypothetical protein